MAGNMVMIEGAYRDAGHEGLWPPPLGQRSEVDDVGQYILDGAAKKYGCLNATHAEANALAFAARQGISTDHGTLYVTVSPCATCSRLLIAAGIVRVVYDEEYRDPSGMNLLREAGVSVGN